MELTAEQIELLYKVVYGEWILNTDTGLVDVIGDVHFTAKGYKFKKIPVAFGEVSGHFDCSYLGLETLKGCPYKVGGDFSCSGNKLTSLKYAPKWIGGRMYPSKNPLESIDWIPEHLGKEFYIDFGYVNENNVRYISEKDYCVLIPQIDYFIEKYNIQLYDSYNLYYKYRNYWVEKNVFSLID